ncbi:MAG: 16S rRNA (cytosine(1402)-N(4))-methyltransferase RsmH [Syntrophorhabdaceae bacterium]|nr:16S rRNA (cytosine(1402)-N(4))-methyltransferase RsmH [Syntrophorhabdaceae bacterium]
MPTGHTPVLLNEALELLAPAPGEVFLDGTAGAGGHAAEIAERIGPAGLLIFSDEDPSMLAVAAEKLAPFPWARPIRSDFSNLVLLREAAGGREFDGILLDLGISSLQLDDPSRGFTFRAEGPLDMRRYPEGGGTTADEILRTGREKELADLFYLYGEERFSRRIARAVVERRRKEPLQTTTELAELVASAIPRRTWQKGIHPATRVFQALRIAVNRELSSLEAFLGAFPEHLSKEGRAAVISFHSLEDRLVKTTFRRLAQRAKGEKAAFETLTRKPVVPTEQEISENSRARSAKLRAIRKSHLGEGTK